MPTQSHHLIPQNVIDRHPLFQAMKAGNSSASIDPVNFNGFRLDLPNRATAEASAAALTMGGDIADTAHQGRHWKAYDRLVEAYLNEFQADYAEPDGNGGFRLKAGADIAELLNNLKSLDVRLADLHTGQVGLDGKTVIAPEIILNRADPRITSGVVSADDAIARMERLAANAGADINGGEFGNLHNMWGRLGELNVGGDQRTGLDYVHRKFKIALESGLDTLNGTDIARYVSARSERALAALQKNDAFRRLEEVFNKLKHNEDGSVEVGGKLLGLSDKLGAVDFMAIGLLGLSLYQIAKEADVEIEDIIDALDIELTPEMLQDAAVGVVKMVFTYAVLTMATGGLGTVLRMAYLASEVADSIDLLKLSLEVYKIAFPDGVLADIIESALPDELGAGESFAKAHVKSERLLEYFGIDFEAFNEAKNVIIADDRDGDVNTRLLRLTEALGTNEGDFIKRDKEGNAVRSNGADILWGRNGTTVDGRGGNDLVFHTGYGTARGGAGNDVVIGQEAKFIKAGTPIDQEQQDKADARRLQIAAIEAQNIMLRAFGLPELPVPEELPDSLVAIEDMALTLDGGEGNDMVLAIHDGTANSIFGTGKGDRATTIGGLGRDWIYNTSVKGTIWGDVANSFEQADGTRGYLAQETDAQGETVTVVKTIADNASNADNFWFARDVTIMDAQKSDRLKFYGITLTGGDTTATSVALAVSALVSPLFGAGLAGAAAAVNLGRMASDQPLIYFDRFVPWINYKLVDGEAEGTKDLLVGYVLDDLLNLFGGAGANTVPKGVMRIVDFDRGAGRVFSQAGDLGISLDDFNPMAILSLLAPRLAGVPIAQSLITVMLASAMAASVDYMARRYTGFAKENGWLAEGDPLVIDLDGDGIETIGLQESRAYFDVDGDMFREKTGWLKGDDGFLVLDANANGRIDDIAEMFGNRFEGGYAKLAAYDSNADGKISVGDLVWSELKVWQDRDRDGETDAGELKSLTQLGILELSLTSTALNATTPQGTQLLSYGSVTFDSGRVSTMFEAIFNSNDTVTKYAGESGLAPWQGASTLNAKGFGTITDLAVATANDVGLAELAQTRAAAMTSANLRTLVAQAGDVLGAWGMTLETSRELIAVRLSATGELLEHRLWDGGALDAGWTLEQAWSPTTRSAAQMPARDEAPYLTQVINGRAVILDYGIRQLDGTWKLASDPSVSYASVEDLFAQRREDAKAIEAEWRTEDIQTNPLADITVENIGVYFVGGTAVDYTVRVTDNDGSFYVWARNLDRALQLQAKTGAAYEFNLRNFAVDLETLDEVNSTDDSTFRVELLTPAQFHFATSLGGIDFRPEMLSASYDNVTGQLAYTVNGVRGAGRYVGKVDADGNPVMVTYSDGTVEQQQEYQSDVKTMISLLQPVLRKTAKKVLLASQTSQGTRKWCEVKPSKVERKKKWEAPRFGSLPRCRSGAAGGIFRMSKSDAILAGQILHCKGIEQRNHRVAVAANDNQMSAWREAAFPMSLVV